MNEKDFNLSVLQKLYAVAEAVSPYLSGLPDGEYKSADIIRISRKRQIVDVDFLRLDKDGIKIPFSNNEALIKITEGDFMCRFYLYSDAFAFLSILAKWERLCGVSGKKRYSFVLNYKKKESEQSCTDKKKVQEIQKETANTTKVLSLSPGDLLQIGEYILFVVADGRYMTGGAVYTLEEFINKHYPNEASVNIIYKRASNGYKAERKIV